jgi:hypothetical protein
VGFKIIFQLRLYRRQPVPILKEGCRETAFTFLSNGKNKAIYLGIDGPFACKLLCLPLRCGFIITSRDSYVNRRKTVVKWLLMSDQHPSKTAASTQRTFTVKGSSTGRRSFQRRISSPGRVEVWYWKRIGDRPCPGKGGKNIAITPVKFYTENKFYPKRGDEYGVLFPASPC